MALADVNQDGKGDVVAFGGTSGAALSVFINSTPTGAVTPTFGPRAAFDVGSSFGFAIRAADLNDDGAADIITSRSAGISINMNRTTSGATTTALDPATSIPTGSNTFSLAVADLNGDGLPDVVVTNQSNATATVLINTTTTAAINPSFAANLDLAAGVDPTDCVLADVDGDAKLDLVVLAASAASPFAVFRNTTPTGATTESFASRVNPPAPPGPRRIVAADVNGDGKADLVSVHPSGLSGTVRVYLNTRP